MFVAWSWSNSSNNMKPKMFLAVRLVSLLLRTRTESSAIAEDFTTVTIRHICDGCHDFCHDCDGCHDFCHNCDKCHGRGTPTFKLKCVACDGFTTGNRKKTESIRQATRTHSSIFLACTFSLEDSVVVSEASEPSHSLCANHALTNQNSTRDRPFPDVPEGEQMSTQTRLNSIVGQT
jgi:hypothetical protein